MEVVHHVLVLGLVFVKKVSNLPTHQMEAQISQEVLFHSQEAVWLVDLLFHRLDYS